MGRSKPSGAPATGSRADPFRSARRRLTLLYLATIAAIVAVLSSALYELHFHDVEHLDGRVRPPEVEGRPIVHEAGPRLGEYLEHLGRSIIIADVITIVTCGGLGYLLAARTLRPIREAVEAEQRFFADAAHDLRTPLAVMRSEAEVALRGRPLDPAEARLVIASSLEEIRRMSTMVEQMLDLARRGRARDRRPHDRKPFDLAALAEATTARMALRARERGVRLATEAPAQVMIPGDASAVERAVYNVLENAITYTPGGGCVTVRVRREGGDAVLEVADTGIGIPPDDLPHITEPFFRGDKARGGNEGGAGLGLTIVKATMDDHRGSIRAESGPGVGTTISLRFPAL